MLRAQLTARYAQQPGARHAFINRMHDGDDNPWVQVWGTGERIAPTTDEVSWIKEVKNEPWGGELYDMIQHQPILRFFDALQPLVGLVDQILEMGRQARDRAVVVVEGWINRGVWQEIEGNVGTETMKDMVAMIVLYTMQWPENFYSRLNKELNNTSERCRNSLAAWMPAIKLFDVALTKLPAVYRINLAPNEGFVWVYRGVGTWRFPSLAQPDVAAYFPFGAVRFIFSFKSHSADRAVAVAFMGGDLDRIGNLIPPTNGEQSTSTMYEVQINEGYDVSALSIFPDEREIILRPLSLFRVTSAVNGTAERLPDIVRFEQIGRNRNPPLRVTPQLRTPAVTAFGDPEQIFYVFLDSQPLVSLDAALAPLHGFVEGLQQMSIEARQRADVVLQKWITKGRWQVADEAGPASFPMMVEMLAMIVLYTTQDSFSKLLNDTMANRVGRVEKLHPWMSVIKLLDEALAHLPVEFRVGQASPVLGGSTYARAFRGLQRRVVSGGDPRDTIFRPNRMHVTDMFTSYCPDKRRICNGQAGLEMDDQGNFLPTLSGATVFEMFVCEGYDVSALRSDAPQEKEIIVRPLSVFRVESAVDGRATRVPDVVRMTQLGRSEIEAHVGRQGR